MARVLDMFLDTQLYRNAEKENTAEAFYVLGTKAMSSSMDEMLELLQKGEAAGNMEYKRMILAWHCFQLSLDKAEEEQNAMIASCAQAGMQNIVTKNPAIPEEARKAAAPEAVASGAAVSVGASEGTSVSGAYAFGMAAVVVAVIAVVMAVLK